MEFKINGSATNDDTILPDLLNMMDEENISGRYMYFALTAFGEKDLEILKSVKSEKFLPALLEDLIPSKLTGYRKVLYQQAFGIISTQSRSDRLSTIISCYLALNLDVDKVLALNNAIGTILKVDRIDEMEIEVILLQKYPSPQV